MSKTVLFFPGQASQYVGMGRDLYDASAEVRALYDLASKEIGEDIAQLSFDGPADELKRTRFTQPAILLHSLAVLTVMGDKQPDCDFVCGHSLGEYSALAAAGALSFEDAIRAVVKRASLMEEACVKNPGTMAALMGLGELEVSRLCEKASLKGVVIPANYNSKIQIAISGATPAVEEAVALAPEMGAKRAVMLEVGGAFHSPLMEPARDGLESFLADMTFNEPRVPVVANVTAQPVTDPEAIRSLLVEQVTAPVKWMQTMEFLVGQDVSTIIEIGPGKVLRSLAKREMRPANLHTIDTMADIESFSAVESNRD